MSTTAEEISEMINTEEISKETRKQIILQILQKGNSSIGEIKDKLLQLAQNDNISRNYLPSIMHLFAELTVEEEKLKNSKIMITSDQWELFLEDISDNIKLFKSYCQKNVEELPKKFPDEIRNYPITAFNSFINLFIEMINSLPLTTAVYDNAQIALLDSLKELQMKLPKDEFFAFLSQIKGFIDKYSFKKPNCLFVYAWQEETKIWGDILDNLCEHLRAVGINCYIDRFNQMGSSIYSGVEKIANCDYVVLVGTKSILEKHGYALFVLDEYRRIQEKSSNNSVPMQFKVITLLSEKAEHSSLSSIKNFYTALAFNKNYVLMLKDLIAKIYMITDELYNQYELLWNEMEHKYLQSFLSSFDFKKDASEVVIPVFDKKFLSRPNFKLPPRNINFIGREYEITKLKDIIKNYSRTAIIINISGLAGVGKTQLALAFAYHRHETREHLFIGWINFHNIENDFKELAEFLGLSVKNLEKHQLLYEIYETIIEKYKGGLLLIDCAQVCQFEDLKPYLPQANGKIIIIVTSLNCIEEIANNLPLSVFSPQEALKYVDTSLSKESMRGQNSEKAIWTLVEKLGYYPLALFSAVTYINRTTMSLEEYIELLLENPANLLNKSFNFSESNYQLTLKQAFFTTFAAAEKHAPLAWELLCRCIYLASEAISSLLFKDSYKEKDFKIAVSDLVKYSLVQLYEPPEQVLSKLVLRKMLPEIGQQLSSIGLHCAIVYAPEKNTESFVQELAELLKLAGFSILSQISPGQEQWEFIEQVTACDVIFVIGTPEFKKVIDIKPKGSPLHLIVSSLFSLLVNNNYKIIPILLGCDGAAGLPLFFLDIASLDWNKGNYADNVWRLLKSALARSKLTEKIDLRHYKKTLENIFKLSPHHISELFSKVLKEFSPDQVTSKSSLEILTQNTAFYLRFHPLVTILLELYLQEKLFTEESKTYLYSPQACLMKAMFLITPMLFDSKYATVNQLDIDKHVEKILVHATRLQVPLDKNLLSYLLIKAIQKVDIAGVKKWLTQKPLINIQDQMHHTPLHYAIIALPKTLTVSNSPSSEGKTDIKHYDLTIIKLLLQEGADPNIPDAQGETALYYAADNGYNDVVPLLLEYNADPNKHCHDVFPYQIAKQKGHKEIAALLKQKSNDNRFTKLYNAIIDEDISLLESMLSTEPQDVNREINGKLPIVIACSKGRDLRVAEYLLSLDALEMNKQQSSDGYTAMHVAAENDKGSTILGLLLAKPKADANIQNNNGETPLHLAVATGNIENVDKLLNAKVDINPQDNQGRTPLIVAAGLLRPNERIVKYLLQANADLSIQDKLYGTALHAAAFRGHRKITKLLLKYGADMQIKSTAELYPGKTARELANDQGFYQLANTKLLGKELRQKRMTLQCRTHMDTGLLEACINGDLTAVEDYYNHSNATSEISKQLLFAAISARQIKIVEYLIDHEKDILQYAKDAQGNTPLHIAATTGDVALMKLFSKHFTTAEHPKMGMTPLHLAVLVDNLYAARFLLSETKFNPKTKASITGSNYPMELDALQIAVVKGSLEMVSLLTNYYSKLDQMIPKIGNLLHLAVFVQRNQILAYLLDQPSIPNSELLNQFNDQEQTPLAMAAWRGNSEAIRLLVKQGVNINLRNYEGNTPLHFAVLGVQYDILRLLIELGADLNIHNNQKETPYQLAQRLIKSTENELSVVAKSERSTIAERLANYNRILENLKSKTFSISVLKNIRLAPGASLKIGNINLALAQTILSKSRIKNLVFQGSCFPTTLSAYLGALQTLEDQDKGSKVTLKHINRVAGTSFSAIISLLLALGFTLEQMEYTIKNFFHLLAENSYLKVLHKNFDILKRKDTDILNDLIAWYKIISIKPNYNSQLVTNYFQLIKRIFNLSYDISDNLDSTLQNWIEDIIRQRVATNNLTFGELHQLIQQGKSFKELYIATTKLTDKPELTIFNSEDNKFKDIIISDVIKASLVTYFQLKPCSIRIKRNESTLLFEGLYADGGIIDNYPLDIFDQFSYQQSYVADEYKDFPIFNEETLGICALRSQAPKYSELNVDSIKYIKNFESLAKIIEQIYSQNRHLSGNFKSEDFARSILLIDNVDDKPLNIPNLENQDKLIKLGRAAVFEFFSAQKTALSKKEKEKLSVSDNTFLFMPPSKTSLSIQALIQEAKKIVNPNSTISIIFTDEKLVSQFQNRLTEEKIYNPGMIGEPRKPNIRNAAINNIVEYEFILQLEEYNDIMGKGAFELLLEGQNVSFFKPSKSEESDEEKKPEDDKDYAMMGPKG